MNKHVECKNRNSYPPKNTEYPSDDFDRYVIHVTSPMNTGEYNIIVDFKENKIAGDCIAYGEWYDIGADECRAILDKINPSLIYRDYNNIS